MSAYPITAINTLFLDRERKLRKGADDRDRRRHHSNPRRPATQYCSTQSRNRASNPELLDASPSPSLVLVELLSVILSREICSGISQLSTSRRRLGRSSLFWPWVAEKLISCPDTPLLFFGQT